MRLAEDTETFCAKGLDLAGEAGEWGGAGEWERMK